MRLRLAGAAPSVAFFHASTDQAFGSPIRRNVALMVLLCHNAVRRADLTTRRASIDLERTCPVMSERSHRLMMPFAVSCLVLTLSLTGPAPFAWAQTDTPKDLFTKVGTLTLSDGTPALGTVSLSGDIAVGGGGGKVHVFEREPGGDRWLHTATLIPSDGTSGFGVSVGTDGKTIVAGANAFVVGAEGAVFVFTRTQSHGWREVARLTGSVNAVSFGGSVAVSGATVMVGASRPSLVLFPPELGPGVVYVFEQEGSAENWVEVARLVGEPHSRPNLQDGFGSGLSIDGDTAIVSAIAPHTTNPFDVIKLAYLFSRSDDESSPWPLAARLFVASGEALGGGVSISGDTAVATARGFDGGNLASIFQRDQARSRGPERVAR
jgi:hypothetical protein